MTLPKRYSELEEEFGTSLKISTWIFTSNDNQFNVNDPVVQQKLDVLAKHISKLRDTHGELAKLTPEQVGYHPDNATAARAHHNALMSLRNIMKGGAQTPLIDEFNSRANIAFNLSRKLMSEVTPEVAPETASETRQGSVEMNTNPSLIQTVQLLLEELMQLARSGQNPLNNGESLSTILRHDKGHDDWHRDNGQSPCTSDDDCAAKAAEIKGKSVCNCGQPGCPKCNCNCGLSTCPQCGRQVVASSWIDEYSNLDSDW